MRNFIRLTIGLLFVNVTYILCKYYILVHHKKEYSDYYKSLSYIYVITPTRRSLTQKADLTRLSHTLMHVPNLLWVVIEDSNVRSKLVTSLLKKAAVNSVHLNATTNPKLSSMKGMAQRNEGLKWLRKYLEKQTQNGIIYFADVDNTYSLGLFSQMRSLKWISVWPVGLLPPLYESPKVENGKVVGWNSWAPKQRTYAVDMAGFAFNTKVLDKFPKLSFRPTHPGYQETAFISQFVSKLDELEPGAKNCTEILVWHSITCYSPVIKTANFYNKTFSLEM